MERKNLFFSARQIKELTALSKKKGITFSELVRRILDEYIEREAR